MKSNAIIVAATIVLALFAGCNRASKQDGSKVTTTTIAPAQAQPDTSGTSDALTQTVDVENGRSEEDGGGASAGPASEGTTSTAAAAPAKAHPAKPRRK